MIKKIYGRSLTVMARKNFRLWGLSLLFGVLCFLAGTLCGVVPLLNVALCALLTAGMNLVFLHGYLGEEVYIENLFDGFRGWSLIGRLLGGMGMMYLKIFLWALIPVAGIVFATIKAYAFRLTPYILMLEPEVKTTEAYKVSEQRTRGYKAKMFWADLLWPLLVGAASAILFLLAQIPFVGFLFGIVGVLVLLCVILFGNLFSGLVESAFYVEIQRNCADGPKFDDSQNEFDASKFKKEAFAPEGKCCPTCGALNVVQARFCSGCGYNFDATPAEAAATAAEKAPASEEATIEPATEVPTQE